MKFCIYFFTLLLYSCAGLQVKNVQFSEAKDKYLYIRSLKLDANSKNLQRNGVYDEVNHGIVLALINEKSKNFKIIDDSAIVSLIDQATQKLLFTKDDDQTIQKIGKSLGFTKLIAGDIAEKNGKITLYLKKMGKEKDRYETEDQINLSFYRHQIGYYIKQIAKRILDSKYKIKKDAPDFLEAKVIVSDISIEKIALPKTQEILIQSFTIDKMKQIKRRTFSIPKMKFQSQKQDQMTLFVTGLQIYIDQANDWLQQKKYVESLQDFKNVLSSIQEEKNKFKREEQKYLNRLSDDLKKQIADVTKTYHQKLNYESSLEYQQKIQIIDQKFQKFQKANLNQLNAYGKQYDTLKIAYRSLPDYQKNFQIERVFEQRLKDVGLKIDNAVLLNIQEIEEELEKKLNFSTFKSYLNQYKDLLKSYNSSDYSQPKKKVKQSLQNKKNNSFLKMIQTVDKDLQNTEELSLSHFYSYKKQYKDLLKDYRSLSDYQSNYQVENLLIQRIQSINQKLIATKEQQADQLYTSLKFNPSYDRYLALLKEIDSYEIGEYEIEKKRIQKKQNTTISSAQSYIKSQISPLLELAKANHQRYILEAKMKSKGTKNTNPKFYKKISLKLLKKSFQMVKKNNPLFLIGENIIPDYNQTTKLIHPSKKPILVSLKGVDLKGVDLKGVSLKGVSLKGANLRGVDLKELDLKRLDLKGANLKGANLRGVDLKELDLKRLDLKGANLKGANLRGVDLRGVSLAGVNLNGANLYRAKLNGANLKGLDLKRVSLAGVNLNGANLRGANLRRANLWDADLRRANLRRANLRRANLRDADLRGANLYGADLRGANLDGANLIGAKLNGANLIGAKLNGANLIGLDLKRVSLAGANLAGANLERANLRRANLWDADLRRANLYRANLRRANLRDADLRGANLWDADLRRANLYRANLRRAKLWDANLKGANLTGANLDGAKLGGAIYDSRTKFPTGFSPKNKSMVKR